MTKILHFLAWPFLRLVFKVNVKFRVLGVENIAKTKGPVIFTSNHESYFDPFLIGAALPWFSSLHPVRSLAHDSLFEESKRLNFLLRIGGAFPGRAHKGDESALKTPLQLLSKGDSLIIFNEWCYDFNPAKSYVPKMISSLSLKKSVPIIPVYIYGIYDGGITWKKIFQRKREVSVAFGNPILPEVGNSEEKIEMLVEKGLLYTKLNFIKTLHEEEKQFWNGYAQFYYYLERAEPYQELMSDFSHHLPDEIRGRWLDLGSGSGGVVDLLAKKKRHGAFTEITASDVDPTMIKHLTLRFSDLPSVKIRPLDLALPFDVPTTFFDGVTSNLVLPYVTYHQGEIGKSAFKHLLRDIYKILRPDGIFVWSTPKKNVNFGRAFAKSWKAVLDPHNLSHMYYGPAILMQALKIQHKGKTGLYSFLDTNELREILEEIGFKDITFARSMAGQVDIISCKK
jgi:1-acyl-sn-glycerol-3-phosphate acyltransferase